MFKIWRLDIKQASTVSMEEKHYKYKDRKFEIEVWEVYIMQALNIGKLEWLCINTR